MALVPADLAAMAFPGVPSAAKRELRRPPRGPAVGAPLRSRRRVRSAHGGAAARLVRVWAAPRRRRGGSPGRAGDLGDADARAAPLPGAAALPGARRPRPRRRGRGRQPAAPRRGAVSRSPPPGLSASCSAGRSRRASAAPSRPALALVSPLAGPAALAGAALLAPRQAAALELHSPGARPPVACIAAQRGAGRVFLVQPSRDQAAWVAGDRLTREAALGWGYTPLLDGRRAARRFAPLRRGRSRRTSPRPTAVRPGAGGSTRWRRRRIVAQHPVVGFPELCRDGRVHRARQPARRGPRCSVARAMPAARRALARSRRGRGRGGTGDERLWRVRVDAAACRRSLSRDPRSGVELPLDGRRSRRLSGAGDHPRRRRCRPASTGRARYRPPGLAGGRGRLADLGAGLVGVAWRRW